VTVTGNVPVVEVDRGAVAGAPSRLAWSPDGKTLYLRFTKRDVWGNERDAHFVVSLADGKLQPAASEPDWAPAYWAFKSALTAPGLPDFRIAVETREERKTATGVVSAGSMAQSGGDPSLGAILGPQGQAIAQSTAQAQMVTTTTFKVKGELIGEFVNQVATPGLTYSWAPAGWNALVVVGHKGRLVTVDAAGHKRDLTDAGDWTLPAWSPDGTRLAAVRVANKKKVTIQLFTLSR
jgi:dipeptidyl aminopeptidase/acylaminoacyl peptidase